MRSRIVKPEFFKHGELYDCEKASGLPIRLAFAGLWGIADRAGRFAWRPRELKLDILPYDDCDFAEVLAVLERAAFVRSYVVEGKRYGVIPTLKDHQNFHRREAASRLPPEPDEPEASTNEGPAKDSPRTTPVRVIAGTSPADTDTDTDTDTASASKSPRRHAERARDTWITPFATAWGQRYGGKMPIGPALKPLKDLLATPHALPEVLRRWGIYLAATEGSYANAQRFAATYGEWEHPPPSGANGSRPGIAGRVFAKGQHALRDE